MAHPSDVIATAYRMVAICPCEWMAADRDFMTKYLALHQHDPEAVADLPLFLEVTGTFYRLRVRR